MLSNIPVDAMWSKMSNVTSLLPRRMVSLLGCAVLLFINTMTAYGGLVSEETSSSAVPVPDEAPWQFVRKLGTSYSGPYFDDNHPTNVNAQLGGHAFLPCTVKRRGTRLVSWVRKTDGALVSVDRDVFIGDDRFSSAYDAITDTWTLQIRGVRMQDAGFFECQVSSEPKTAIVVRLHIVVPKIEINRAPDIFVMDGSPVELQCVITNVIEEPPFIFWYHEGERVPDYENTRPQPYAHESQSRRALRTDQVAAGELAVPVPYIYRSERRNFRNGDADRRVAMFGDGQGNEDDDDEGGILADRSKNIHRPLLNDTQRRESMLENQGGQGLSKSSALIASIPFKSFNILRLEANIIVSVMSISSATLDDAGIYECSPSNLPIASVMLHVLNGEHPAAIQESKNASTASNRAAGHVGYPHWCQVCSCWSAFLTAFSLFRNMAF